MSKRFPDTADSRWAFVLVCAAVLPYSVAFPSFMYAKEIAIAVVILALFVRAAILGRAPQLPMILAPMLIVIAISAIARDGIAPIAERHMTAEAALRWSLVATGCVATTTLSAESVREALPRYIAAIALGLACLMPFQHLDLVPWLFPDFPTYGQTMYSVFGNQALLGGFLALGFAAWGFVPAATKGTRAYRFAATLTVALGAVATGSVSACAALVAALVAGSLARREVTASWIAAGAIAMAAAVAAFVIDSGSMGTVDFAYRPWFWRGALLMFVETPILGGGLGSFAYRSPQALGDVIHAPGGESIAANGIHTLHAHNDYLELIADTGIVGIIAMLFAIRILVRQCRPEVWALIAPMAAFAALTPFFVHVPFAVIALFCVVAFRKDADVSLKSRRIFAAVGATTIIVVSASLGYIAWWPGIQLQVARGIHMRGEDPSTQYADILKQRWPQPEAARDFGSYCLANGDYVRAMNLYQAAEGMGLLSADVYRGLALSAYMAGEDHDDEALRAAEAWIARWPRAPEPWAIRIALGHERADVRTDSVGHIEPEEWEAVTTTVDALIGARDQRE